MKNTKKGALVTTALILMTPLSASISQAQNTAADRNAAAQDTSNYPATTEPDQQTTTTTTTQDNTNQYAQEQKMGEPGSGTSPFLIAVVAIGIVGVIAYARRNRNRTHL